VDTLVSANNLFGAQDLFSYHCIGGAFDTVPEVCILLALFNHSKEFYPVVFDEAGMYDTDHLTSGCLSS
jgi:hypothetical protein